MSPTNMNQQTSTENHTFKNWVAETQSQLATDPRVQPWKQTFGDQANRGSGTEDNIFLGGVGSVQHNAGSAESSKDTSKDNRK